MKPNVLNIFMVLCTIQASMLFSALDNQIEELRKELHKVNQQRSLQYLINTQPKGQVFHENDHREKLKELTTLLDDSQETIVSYIVQLEHEINRYKKAKTDLKKFKHIDHTTPTTLEGYREQNHKMYELATILNADLKSSQRKLFVASTIAVTACFLNFFLIRTYKTNKS